MGYENSRQLRKPQMHLPHLHLRPFPTINHKKTVFHFYHL